MMCLMQNVAVEVVVERNALIGCVLRGRFGALGQAVRIVDVIKGCFVKRCFAGDTSLV